jgi:hypothetical protein
MQLPRKVSITKGLIDGTARYHYGGMPTCYSTHLVGQDTHLRNPVLWAYNGQNMPSAVTGKLFKLTTPHQIYTHSLKINTLYIVMRTASAT